MIANFFTGIMPTLAFIVYSDKWSEHFRVSPEELKEKLFSVFQITHPAYHKVQLMKMKKS